MDEAKRALLQEQVDRASEAVQFLRYIENEKYFFSVLAEIETNLANQILSLKPNETEKFTVLQVMRNSLYEPIKKIHWDKLNGEQAAQELDGTPQKGGLL